MKLSNHVEIVAEAGVNHNGELATALALVAAALEVGADVVKFQLYQTERLLVPDHPDFQMLKGLELTLKDFEELAWKCRVSVVSWRPDLEFLVSVFHTEAVAWAEKLRVIGERTLRPSLRRLKIPSGELTNLPLIQAVAEAGFPVIISTGMARLSEVEAAIESFEAHRTPGAYIDALLHCTSEYPADPAHANLRAMETLRRAFGYPVGLSDHTPGWEVAVAAVALGAVMVEKHLTLDSNQEGPDHKSSLMPAEFTQMVKMIRNIERALGDGRKRPSPAEGAMAQRSRKKLVAAVPIPKGVVITEEMVTRLRAEGGLHANTVG